MKSHAVATAWSYAEFCGVSQETTLLDASPYTVCPLRVPTGTRVSLATVTVTSGDVVEWPAASRAIAVSRCEPFGTVAVSQLIEYGLAVSSPPIEVPSH